MRRWPRILASLQLFWLDEPSRHSNFNKTRDISRSSRPKRPRKLAYFLQGFLHMVGSLWNEFYDFWDLNQGAEILPRIREKEVQERLSDLDHYIRKRLREIVGCFERTATNLGFDPPFVGLDQFRRVRRLRRQTKTKPTTVGAARRLKSPSERPEAKLAPQRRSTR